MPKRDSQPIIIALILLGIIVLLLFVLITKKDANPTSSDEVCDLIDNDGDGEVDEGYRVTCSRNNDCGASARFGSPYCKEGNVWQGKYINSCVEQPGTCMSKCLGQQSEERIEECSDGCENGACV